MAGRRISRISGWCITPATGRFTAAVRLLGYVDCLSRVPGDWYARFCGEGVIAISSPYPTSYLAELPVEKVWGIGANTAAFLAKHRIHTALEFARASEQWVKANLSKPFREIWQ